ncbi:uncharacterized protein BDR25DRAFT_319848 [Lindgomyces ingoldianus]|uniref:Uncharacterized protein n=1 Tax=Lindgomyces ingoldianus TaxID=673940 RepID=A0ACB6QAN2_9PLEO|nr:uncharacterized protein BDR25DRAFT_319848 [Lindgomyces ingoldianus]KAF2463643.1 hypothetical protein BDR25DRAFT_319848 [Lindgomyces ingoldianus]
MSCRPWRCCQTSARFLCWKDIDTDKSKTGHDGYYDKAWDRRCGFHKVDGIWEEMHTGQTTLHADSRSQRISSLPAGVHKTALGGPDCAGLGCHILKEGTAEGEVVGLENSAEQGLRPVFRNGLLHTLVPCANSNTRQCNSPPAAAQKQMG